MKQVNNGGKLLTRQAWSVRSVVGVDVKSERI